MPKKIFKIRNIAIPFLIVLCGAVSLLAYILNFPGSRRVFIFRSSDSDRLSIEKRYLKGVPESQKISNYVDELLLGPVSEHCVPVFALGTRNISCFEREGTVYVNLSNDMLKGTGKLSDFKYSLSLLEKNIMTNFPSVKVVEVFIDGHKPYEYLER